MLIQSDESAGGMYRRVGERTFFLKFDPACRELIPGNLVGIVVVQQSDPLITVGVGEIHGAYAVIGIEQR